MSTSHDDDPNLQELPPSINSFNVCSRGFSDADLAQRVGRAAGAWVGGMSRHIDLERLDGVTVAGDYPEALADLDRGLPLARALTPTNDGMTVGVAMTPAVIRDGVVKGHIVIAARTALSLLEEQGEQWQRAVHTLAHECGHVEDLKHRDICFPGTILQKTISDLKEKVVDPAAWGLWEEYAASRVSAAFADERIKGTSKNDTFRRV